MIDYEKTKLEPTEWKNDFPDQQPGGVLPMGQGMQDLSRDQADHIADRNESSQTPGCNAANYPVDESGPQETAQRHREAAERLAADGSSPQQ